MIISSLPLPVPLAPFLCHSSHSHPQMVLLQLPTKSEALGVAVLGASSHGVSAAPAASADPRLQMWGDRVTSLIPIAGPLVARGTDYGQLDSSPHSSGRGALGRSAFGHVLGDPLLSSPKRSTTIGVVPRPRVSVPAYASVAANDSPRQLSSGVPVPRAPPPCASAASASASASSGFTVHEYELSGRPTLLPARRSADAGWRHDLAVATAAKQQQQQASQLAAQNEEEPDGGVLNGSGAAGPLAVAAEWLQGGTGGGSRSGDAEDSMERPQTRATAAQVHPRKKAASPRLCAASADGASAACDATSLRVMVVRCSLHSYLFSIIQRLRHARQIRAGILTAPPPIHKLPRPVSIEGG